MERIYSLLALLMIAFSIGRAQVNNGVDIEGSIKGLKSGSKLFLIIKKNNKIDTISSSTAKDESFTFKNASLPYYPDFYLITVQSEFVAPLKLFLNQVENIKIVGTLEKWPSVNVSGSKTHEDFITYTKYLAIANQELDSFSNTFKSNVESIERMKQNNRKSIFPFIEKYPASYVVPYALLIWKSWDGKQIHPDDKRPYYDRLPQNVKDSFYGRQLRSALEKEVKLNAIRPGDFLPQISISTQDNKTERILEIVKRNRLTLIDCWASWCHPCRNEIHELKRMYDKYKEKGFNIAGISIDKDVVAWKKAVVEDGTKWPHYIDDQSSSFSGAFGVIGVPAYFLVNDEGRIIAFDGHSKMGLPFGGGLRGIALDKKLEELLGK